MSVGIRVGSVYGEIGAPSFFHCFCSTVSAHCEADGWGSRFPHLLNELYGGRLPAGKASAALVELRVAKAALAKLPPKAVVWDIDDKSARPPWGDNIAPEITNLANYFVSSTGQDLFTVLENALAVAVKENRDAVIE